MRLAKSSVLPFFVGFCRPLANHGRQFLRHLGIHTKANSIPPQTLVQSSIVTSEFHPVPS